MSKMLIKGGVILDRLIFFKPERKSSGERGRGPGRPKKRVKKLII